MMDSIHTLSTTWIIVCLIHLCYFAISICKQWNDLLWRQETVSGMVLDEYYRLQTTAYPILAIKRWNDKKSWTLLFSKAWSLCLTYWGDVSPSLSSFILIIVLVYCYLHGVHGWSVLLHSLLCKCTHRLDAFNSIFSYSSSVLFQFAYKCDVILPPHILPRQLIFDSVYPLFAHDRSFP